MPYLLDTNAWIHYLKQPGSAIHAKLAALRPDDVVTCSMVRSELLHGAEKYGNRNRRIAAVNQTLASIIVYHVGGGLVAVLRYRRAAGCPFFHLVPISAIARQIRSWQ